MVQLSDVSVESRNGVHIFSKHQIAAKNCRRRSFFMLTLVARLILVKPLNMDLGMPAILHLLNISFLEALAFRTFDDLCSWKFFRKLERFSL